MFKKHTVLLHEKYKKGKHNKKHQRETTFKLKTERLIILRNLKLMLVFRFHELPGYSWHGALVFVLLVMAKLSSFTSFGFSFQEKKFLFSSLPSCSHLKMRRKEPHMPNVCVLLSSVITSVSEGGA